MGMQLNPYLSFKGDAAEAMTFYQSVLGGELQVTTFKEAGMDMPGIMHAALDAPNDFHLFAADHTDGMGPELVVGNNVQVSLSGDDADSLRGYWEKLSEGATVVVPLEKQMWGDVYGQLTDRFGIIWHVNILGSAA